MQAAKKETVFEFPEGGIADFYMTDEQFAELERREEVGHGGIANVHHIADRIAEYGRYGDDTLAHVETGELIVPKALLEKNPALKASIFEHLEELGVEDPERYIVGSGANSLNPDTQLPEFFLKKIFKKAKKVFKKVVKGVKKALKKVGKVLKKASSVILPVVLNVAFPGMGAIMTGALSGGIGTLINGGNLKDALKAAAIGGVTGAVVKGGFNKITGKAGFVDTIKSEVSNLTNLKSQFSTAGGILDPTSKYYTSTAGSVAGTAAPAAGAQAAPVTTQPLPEIQGPPTAPPIQGPPTAAEAALIGEPTFMQQAVTAAENIDVQAVDAATQRALADPTALSISDAGLDPRIGGQPIDLVPTTPDVIEISAQPSAGQGAVSPPGFEESVQEALLQDPRIKIPGMDKISQPVFEPNVELSQFQTPAAPVATSTVNQVVEQIEPPGFFEALGRGDLKGAFAPRSTLPKPSALEEKFGLTLDKAKQAVSEATPGPIRTYAPALAATGLAAQQMGAFETPVYDPITMQELEESQGETASDLVTAYPEIYRVQDLEVRGSEGPYRQDTLYAYDPQIGLYPVNPFGQPQSGFNQQSQTVPMQSGGAAFPRRTGGIDPSEGVPNQDSVRAMLMPGEFVMTTKAVRGMSRNGDSREGIKNMYSMMRNLEARERKMG